MSLDEAMREYWKGLSKSSRLQCPITGSELMIWSRPAILKPLDGPEYYRSVDNPGLIWMKNPRSLNFLTLVESIGSLAGIRFFRYVEDHWLEVFEVKGYGIFFPENTPSEIIQKEKDRIDEERHINSESASRLPKAVKVEAKTVNNIEVKPLNPPTGILMWHDFRYSDESSKPKRLTETELKSLPTVPTEIPRPNHYYVEDSDNTENFCFALID